MKDKRHAQVHSAEDLREYDYDETMVSKPGESANMLYALRDSTCCFQETAAWSSMALALCGYLGRKWGPHKAARESNGLSLNMFQGQFQNRLFATGLLRLGQVNGDDLNQDC